MSYMDSIFEASSYKNIVSKTALVIDKISEKHNKLSIVHTGLSGGLIGHPVAMALKLNSMHIRKNDQSHGDPIEAGYSSPDKQIKFPYAIVDDFMDSGDTIKKIIKKMKNFFPKCFPVGIVLYDEISFDVWDHKVINSVVKGDFSVYTFWHKAKGYRVHTFDGKEWHESKTLKKF